MPRRSRTIAAVLGGLVLAVTATVGMPQVPGSSSQSTDQVEARLSAPALTPSSGRDRTEAPSPRERAYARPRGRTDDGRPNIVLITADDMSYSDLAYMPVTRRLLGGQGTTFTQALSPHPLCCPARAAILTGQYAQNNGVTANLGGHNYDALEPDTALPVWMRRAGYRTAFTGKYLNGFPKSDPRQPGWDFWDPALRGVYDYRTYKMGNNGRPVRYVRGELNSIDYVNQRATRLVKEYGRKPRPFFIWASHVAPHGRISNDSGVRASSPPVPPVRYRKLFLDEQSPSLRNPSYGVPDDSPHVRPASDVTPARSNALFRARVQSLQAVDAGVRQIVAQLKRSGELRNTYLIFTSDNGWVMGEHAALGKNMPYTESIRVPLLIRGPGVDDQVSRQRALMIDLAPTIAAIGNAAPLVTQDGTSLLPTLRSGAAVRDTVLIQSGPVVEPEGTTGSDGWWWRGVTTQRYTYARYLGEGHVMLYDHTTDPFEERNVAGDPRYAGVVAELERRTAYLGDCAGVSECSRYLGADPVPEEPQR